MKTVLFTLLISVSITAMADWIRIEEENHLEDQLYIDPESVKQTGPMAIMRRVWELQNYAVKRIDLVKSVKRFTEYDCMNRQYRVLQEFRFTESHAKGEEVNFRALDDADKKWQSIQSGSAAEIILNELCPHVNDG